MGKSFLPRPPVNGPEVVIDIDKFRLLFLNLQKSGRAWQRPLSPDIPSQGNKGSLNRHS